MVFFYVHNTYAQSAMFDGTNQINIGDLDVTGNQLTVEALIYHYGGALPNIVSKHNDGSNVNYLLRPMQFEFTTTDGYQALVNPCYDGMKDSTWYHIAATYDGVSAKYYLNGCMVAELAQAGDLITNDLTAVIGGRYDDREYWSGNMDEVRIWNVARTQTEIASNMNNLSSPTTPLSLLAYYKFNADLINSQGDTTWNGLGNPITPTFSTEATTLVPSTDCSCSAVLPIELLSFTLNCQHTQPTLFFSTITETNNDYFIIEKSTDAYTWHTLTQLKGTGNSNTLHQYNYTDNANDAVINYYRLAQIDIDGTRATHPIIIYNDQCLANNNSATTLQLYPNPASNTITISSKEEVIFKIEITNVLGQPIIETETMENNVHLNISQLNAGVYSVKIYTNQTSTQLKLVVTKI